VCPIQNIRIFTLISWKYYVFIYVNGKMRPVEMGRKGSKEE
jgi:hypothetical protein